MPRRLVLATGHCLRCGEMRAAVRRLITWRHDDHGHDRAADPVAVLGDLWAARAALDELFGHVVRDAIVEGAGWESVARRALLDPRLASGPAH